MFDREQAIEKAKEHLAGAKADALPGADLIAPIRRLAERFDFSPEEIGTTWSELDALQLQYRVGKARDHLERARTGTSAVDWVPAVRRWLEDAGLRPEDIETTSQELKMLSEACAERNRLAKKVRFHPKTVIPDEGYL